MVWPLQNDETDPGRVENINGGKVTILKVDVDESPLVSSVYNIQGVPTLILFKNGEIVWRQAGVVPSKHLEQIINQSL